MVMGCFEDLSKVNWCLCPAARGLLYPRRSSNACTVAGRVPLWGPLRLRKGAFGGPLSSELERSGGWAGQRLIRREHSMASIHLPTYKNVGDIFSPAAQETGGGWGDGGLLRFYCSSEGSF